MTNNVSLLAEIPEELHETLKHYLDSHPEWDQDRVFAAALSLFLLQNGGDRQGVSPNASHSYRSTAKALFH